MDTIQKALDERKNVLVASSENAIRGLLMHLCEIPEDRVPEIEIPTGIPMLFDFERRCVRLLDDGQSPAPRERYNFGTGGDLLFTPADGGDMDPHVRLDDEFIVDEVDAECDKEIAADLFARSGAARCHGVRGRLAARRVVASRPRARMKSTAPGAIPPASRRRRRRRSLGHAHPARRARRARPRSPAQTGAGSEVVPPGRVSRPIAKMLARRRRSTAPLPF